MVLVFAIAKGDCEGRSQTLFHKRSIMSQSGSINEILPNWGDSSARRDRFVLVAMHAIIGTHSATNGGLSADSEIAKNTVAIADAVIAEMNRSEGGDQ